MATRFELLVMCDDALYAGQAAEAVFDEIDRLEQQLSRFVANSEIAQLNRLSPGCAIRVGPATMDCLLLACELFEATGGAMDITVGSSLPEGGSGMKYLGLDPDRHCAGVTGPGVRLDLGGLGKGYALDRAAAILGEWGLPEARLHGGHSTVLVLGTPPGEPGWSIAIGDPQGGQDAACLGRVRLKDQAVSGSDSLLQPGHIIDPRTGRAATGKLGTWAVARSAALSDGLSTAFYVMDVSEIEALCHRRSDIGALVLGHGDQTPTLQAFGNLDLVTT